MAGIKKAAGGVQTKAPAKLDQAVERASTRGLLSEKGKQALLDGDISHEDKQMASNILSESFDRAGAAGAKSDAAQLKPAVRDAEIAKELADQTTKQFYKENPSMGAQMMSKLGSFIDAQTLSLHQTTLKNLGQ